MTVDELVALLRETDPRQAETPPVPGLEPPAHTDYGQPEVPSRHTESVNPCTDDCDADYGTPGTPTDYGQQEGLSGDALAAWDGRDEFAAWVCGLAGVLFEEDEQQQLTAADLTLTVSVWREERGLWVVRVWEGWPARPARKASP